AIHAHKLNQWLFYRHWQWVKGYANQHDIQIVGDIPIFVAMDSADAWTNPTEFFLDDQFQPTVVAGVPPDYFSATGQLWGNPLYRWEKMKANGYQWWLRRIRAALRLYDVVRIDHFRGFAAYWEVPAGEETAINGQWVSGPGHDFFAVVKRELGELPIIAEDLGEITPDVIALRDDFGLPGMKI
ncbi:MAG: 4-alpha-glucanotransferase, partial [Candidatus Eremiobacteraeota bacterium]|nr:4-alpha-glucanotransferase [Candidatus Eremiobacteraeota bacterium]